MTATLLISVTDKTGLLELIQAFQKVEPELNLLATTSTASFLETNQIACQPVSSITHFPEILDGRVKTLHPAIFGGILAKNTSDHQAQLSEHGFPAIDGVIVNLYDFETAVASADTTFEAAIEKIDVGGPSLIRAAAKNADRVLVLSDPKQYAAVIETLSNNPVEGVLCNRVLRRQLALEAFEKTAAYDANIALYLGTNRLSGEIEAPTVSFSDTAVLPLKKRQDLRYGENPHQSAAWYTPVYGWVDQFEQLQGKELSANNIMDAYSAFNLLGEFRLDPACCIIKHNNPCGVAISDTLLDAYQKAFECDSVSAFGGIIGLNQTVDRPLAERIIENFVELVLAPDFTPAAVECFKTKKNVRLLKVPGLSVNHASPVPQTALKDLGPFGLILQKDISPEETDEVSLPLSLTTVTQKPLPDGILKDVSFAWAVVKHLTSNAIVVAKDGQTVGFGIGQTSRIRSTQLALAQAGSLAQGAVLASDGFFPATDNIDVAAAAGVSVIVQPGGSIKDAEVIEAADQHRLVMCLTHQRCFKH